MIEREKYNKLISKLNDDEKEIVSLKIISNCSFRRDRKSFKYANWNSKMEIL